MTLSRKGRAAMLAGVAAVMLGALVFLFVRTAGFDSRRDAETASLLRELRALDLRLDGDAGRLANDYSASQPATIDRTPIIARVLRELEQQSGPSVAAQIPGLRAGINEKLTLLATLRKDHARTTEALQTADGALAALTAGAASARQRNPGAAAAAYSVAGQSEALRYQLREASVENVEADMRAVDTRLATLRAAADAADPALAQAAARVESAARNFLGSCASEATTWKKIAFHPAGPQIDLAAQQLAKAFEGALEDQQRWRAYLFFYAAALLVVVAYLGARVITARAQLLAANESLENRVTERTRELSTAMARLKESEAQLVQSEKMSSLGQMVAGVAHEINTPLAYVKNSVATARDRMPELRDALAQAERLLGLLRNEAPDQADLTETFAALTARLDQLRMHHVIEDLDSLTRDGLHGIEQISELVVNLKNFARLDRSRVASFNVNDGVSATLLIARAQLRKCDVEKHLGDIPSITSSPSQVNQVLLNLVTNASQAIDKARGRIVVSTRRVDAGAIAIEVADNGRGIAPDVLPRIFDPFFTTKEVGKGTGLGLSIAYKIVAQHGGIIDVRSEVGVGTTFTVTLPVEPPKEFAAAAARDEVHA
jgi:signal transduction histidine kinase